MLHFIATLASAAGVGLALTAFLVEGSGVDGSVGAILAVIGAAAAMLGALILLTARLPVGLHRTVTGLSLLAAVLTAVAGWFLMQNTLAIAMTVACVALLMGAARPATNRTSSP